jgi:hypothetical protein
MFRYVLRKIQRHIPHTATVQKSELSLQVVLWLGWTLAVVGVAAHHWYIAMLAHARLNLTGLIIDCLLCGLIGLVVITKVEMWIEPWRFHE